MPSISATLGLTGITLPPVCSILARTFLNSEYPGRPGVPLTPISAKERGLRNSSRLSANSTGFIRASSRPPLRQRHALGDLLERHRNGHAEFDALERAIDEIADQAKLGILVELHEHDGERYPVLECGHHRRVHHDPAVDRPPARDRRIFPLERATARTEGTGIEAEALARLTALHLEAAGVARGPEALRPLVGLGQRTCRDHFRLIGHQCPRASKSALVGTPAPLVTRQTSASFTAHTDVPRICRTPSRMRLKPWT